MAIFTPHRTGKRGLPASNPDCGAAFLEFRIGKLAGHFRIGNPKLPLLALRFKFRSTQRSNQLQNPNVLPAIETQYGNAIACLRRIDGEFVRFGSRDREKKVATKQQATSDTQ